MAEDNPPAREFEPKLASAATDDRFRAIFESARVGMVLIDEQCNIFDANSAFCDIVGRDAQALLGTSCMEITHPDDVPKNEQVMIKLAEPDERSASFEKRYLRPDGDVIWVRINLSKITFDEGERVLAVIEDISARKAAEAALSDSEARFRALFEKAGVGMIEIDSDWRILTANPTYCEITGRTAEHLTGQSCLSFTADDDLALSQGILQSLSAVGPGVTTFEKRYVRPDGSVVWVRSNLTRIGQPDGSNRFLKIVEDITDAKLAEIALDEAQQKLREESHNLEILHRIGSTIAGELDLERVVQMVTDAGVELTGAQFGAFFYNVIDEAGESYMLYSLSGADRAQFDKFGMPRNTKVFAPTFAGEGVVRSDDITKDPRYGQNAPHFGKPKGHLPVVSYLAVPVTSRTGEVLGGLFFGHPEPARFNERHERLMEGIGAQAAIAIDNARLFREAQREIEQRVKVEEALTALNETLESRVTEEVAQRSQVEEALRQAQKMETVGQLSGGIAHDFNNLLQIIHGNLTMLKQSMPADEGKWHRAVANALTGAERAAALTQRLLAFSRRQPLEPKPVDINGLIGSMTDLLRRTLGETIRVETALAPDLPPAHVDANQLENAILNLAINARDAMPDGGILGVATDAVVIDEAYSELHPGTSAGSYIRLSVRDNGAGMNPDVLKRAVEPFFTTKEVGQGTGLGLSMVYGFAQQSGGHLVLDSTEGQGTTAELFIPCSTSAAEMNADAVPPMLPRGCGETIVVCEDDDDVRRFSTETLTELGYRVIEAADADSALALLAEAGPVDLLFTDVVLPGGKTGADLAREARLLQPDLSVLLTTGYPRSALDDMDVSPALEVIAKPFSVERLAQRLRQLLDA